MLHYLVTSKARRRLLSLLWGEMACGSVVELAERAGVSFASAQTELKAMHHAQLVNVVRQGNRDIYAANLAHPEAKTLRALVASETSSVMDAPQAGDDVVKRKLRGLGAPLRGVSAMDVARDELVQTLLEGARLARRDAVVARALPLCFWNARDNVEPKILESLAMSAEDKHAVGFFLELASNLGGDRRLLGLAEGLRDKRVKSTRNFFQTEAATRAPARDFPLAEKWGFRMNMDLETFASLFSKFVG